MAELSCYLGDSEKRDPIAQSGRNLQRQIVQNDGLSSLAKGGVVSCSEQGKNKQLRYLRKRTRKVMWVELEKTHGDYQGKKPSVLGLGRRKLISVF